MVLAAYEAVLNAPETGGGDTFEQSFNFNVEINVMGASNTLETAFEVKKQFINFLQGSGRRIVQDTMKPSGWH